MKDSLSFNYSATSILQEILSQDLESDITARPSLVEVQAGKVLLAVKRNGSLLLLIPVNDPGMLENEVSLSETLTLGMRNQIDGDYKEWNFLALSASSGFDLSLFGAICDQAILDLHTSNDYVQLLTRIVESWRDLLDSGSPEKFSASKAIGLFGELLFLKALFEVAGDEALSAWVGPEGARYDFMLPKTALEIKTTTRSDALEIGVHGIDQFGNIPGKSAWLGVAQIEWDPNGTSLRTLVNDVRSKFSNQAVLAQKLKQLDIDENSEMLLEQFRFNPKALFLDQVSTKFPFIKSENLSGALDIHRLRSIAYTVILDGLCTELTPDNQQVELQRLCR